MKITENQLRQIIRKELLLNESVTLGIAGIIGTFVVLSIIKTLITKYLQGKLKNIDQIQAAKKEIMEASAEDNKYIKALENKIKICKKSNPEEMKKLNAFLAEVERDKDILESVMTSFGSKLADDSIEDAAEDLVVGLPTAIEASIGIAGPLGTRSFSRRIAQFFANIVDDTLVAAGMPVGVPYYQAIFDLIFVANDQFKLKGLAAELDMVDEYMAKFRSVGAAVSKNLTMPCDEFVALLVSEKIPGFSKPKEEEEAIASID